MAGAVERFAAEGEVDRDGDDMDNAARVSEGPSLFRTDSGSRHRGERVAGSGQAFSASGTIGGSKRRRRVGKEVASFFVGLSN